MDHFVSLVRPVIASAVNRTLARYDRSTSSIADDLIQDAFLKLCANSFHVLRNFRGTDDNSLCAYLRTVACSTLVDHLNATSALKKGGGTTPVSLDDPEAATLAAQESPTNDAERNLLLSRVETCLSSNNERDRHIFWLYHRYGYTPDAISRYPGIAASKGAVETILDRLTKTIRDCVRGVQSKTAAPEGVRA